MFCRAKIGVVLALAGTLSGWAAPLNLEQKNPALLRAGLVSPAVLNPSQTKTKFSTTSRWRKVKVQKIAPSTKAGVNGFVITKAPDAASKPSEVMLGSDAKK
jgi:hypothetical protein